jgi:hypothetical protein
MRGVALRRAIGMPMAGTAPGGVVPAIGRTGGLASVGVVGG